MGQYDFKRLSFYDFELLSKDLLQKDLGIKLENFKSGRDGGIDLRSITTQDNIVIQCKHYANSTFSNLRTSLRKEVKKLKLLKPTRYIITTSIGLTPANKDEIKKLFDPYIQNTNDIYDQESLNGLLRENPDVEKGHFKLWLSSSSVIERILHSTIHNRTDIRKEKLLKKIELYVETSSFFEAIGILKENQYCIISGAPGIGKTTLAEIITYKYIDFGYNVYHITTIKEAYEIFNKSEKQIFLYDDFLGNTKYSNKVEDSEIINFIEYINKTKNKKLIMTSREYIFNQANNNSEIINRYNLKKCIIYQEEYHKLIKAKILYNHLYFSGIKAALFSKILENKNYINIVNHRNYNPRIIEWMTSTLNVKTLDPDTYYSLFINNLDNPSEIWKFAYERHISEISKYILLVLALATDTIQLECMKMVVKGWYSKDHNISNMIFHQYFRDALSELENTFISIVCKKEITVIKYQNPSIKDFLEEYINQNIDILEDFISLETIFWDQKISLLLELPEKDSSNAVNTLLLQKNELIVDALSNIDFSSLKIIEYSSRFNTAYNSEEQKLDLLLGIVLNYQDSTEDKILNIISETIEINIQSYSYLKSYMFSILKKIPIKYVNGKIRYKLKDLSINSINIEELDKLLILNKKYNFISDISIFKEAVNNCFDSLDYIEDDLDELETIKSSIETVCDELDMEYPDDFYEIEEMITDIEREIAIEEEDQYDMEDYKERVMEQKSAETDIDQIFDTLKCH